MKYNKNHKEFLKQKVENNWTWEKTAEAFNKKFNTDQTKADLMQLNRRSIKEKNIKKIKSENVKEIEKMKFEKLKKDDKIYSSVLVISDMHHPYSHPDTLSFLTELNKKHKFDKIVCIGDEIDNHAISFHDSNPDLPSAGDELKQAIKALEPFYKLFPKVDVIESNHGSLVYRKALNSGLPLAVFKSYNEVLEAPKDWKWVFDLKINTPMGEVYFCHGKTGSSGRLAQSYGMSCIQGHFHEKAQITYISTPNKIMYDMHVGCLADDKSLALGYNKINPKRPVVSVGIIINGIPQIVPMILKKGGRWNGCL
jgi:hypothetical protein